MSTEFPKVSYDFVRIFSVIQKIIHGREIINLIIRCNDKGMCLISVNSPLHGNKQKTLSTPSVCGNAPCPSRDFIPSSFQTLLHAFCIFYSTSVTLFAYHPVFYANLIRLGLLPTSIPQSPISSTHLTYLIITTQGKGVRAVSTTKTKDQQ